MVQVAIDDLPENTVSRRLSDFVFTYHDMDFKNAAPCLWIVMVLQNPSSVSSLPTGAKVDIVFGQVNGKVSLIPINYLPGVLVVQNALRAKYGLPPLPDPPVPSSILYDTSNANTPEPPPTRPLPRM